MGEIEKDIARFILRKLVRHRIWMHKHTSIHNLPKCLPDYLKSKKEVRKVIEALLKDGFLLSKPTNYGLEVSLNIEKKKEIEKIIEGNSL
ncbi:hypothetical protein A3K73_01435 [Candidatus Pacearchaeota archaeon RBG_13_36_9]|nr:MAG: hypothetical protein A3K73_01435 [Candidatus Pacearchaeota archaeon RBG_13_36_9]